MSAVLNQDVNSVYDLDYLSGRFLPHDSGALDRFIESFQAATSLETMTGYMPGSNIDGEHAASLSRWRGSDQSKPFWELLRSAQDGKVIERVAPRASFEPIQEWEGYVVSLGGGGFLARLLDRTAELLVETEEAEFSFEDVSEDDLSLIEPGAVFRWSVGYEKKVTGVRQKISSIVFRRLPIWTAKELDLARVKARTVMGGIQWD